VLLFLRRLSATMALAPSGPRRLVSVAKEMGEQHQQILHGGVLVGKVAFGNKTG
jgi:hypothetical protein